MYAIIEDNGQQYTVRKGELLRIDLKDAAEAESIVFDRVLAVRTDAGLQVGAPTLPGAKVTATVVGETKGPKIVIRKFRRRKNYRRKQGHRQHYTQVRIETIEA
jgi:large subunit ribosomal protein L21